MSQASSSVGPTTHPAPSRSTSIDVHDPAPAKTDASNASAASDVLRDDAMWKVSRTLPFVLAISNSADVPLVPIASVAADDWERSPDVMADSLEEPDDGGVDVARALRRLVAAEAEPFTPELAAVEVRTQITHSVSQRSDHELVTA